MPMTTRHPSTRLSAMMAGAAAPLALAALLVPAPAAAEEGMWTFDAFPAERMSEQHGWAPDGRWLDRVRASAVRLTGGCSASFVSPQGLILTNHHCVIGCLQNLSSAEEDLVRLGFNAAARARERQCPGQQAEVVTAISDVTADVKAAIGSASGEALVKARDGRIAEIEKQGCPDTEKTRCQVVTLFGGGQYKLYRYAKYSDVRIAWAPEFNAAFFGGDPDNFNFPRYALDAAFLRAYEGGRPVASKTHLTWNPRAPIEGESVFVAGNPGSTRRLFTEAQRDFARTVRLPMSLALLGEFRGRLIAKMEDDPVKAREGGDELFGIENSFKALTGQLRALNDPAFAGKLAEEERALKAKAQGQPGAADPWTTIATAMSDLGEFWYERAFIAQPGFTSTLMGYADTLVFAAAERAKPNAERLPGFTDSALPLTEKRLLDPVPTYPWYEEMALSFWLSKAREYLGADSPDTKLLLGRESPEALGERLVAGTKLADPAERRRLWEGGAEAIAASTDPLIVLARQIEPRARAIKQRYDSEVDGPVTAAQAELATARFAAFGDTLYPDATFTLRISYGKVEGWEERGTAVPFMTTMGGTFDRATGAPPFELAAGFVAAKDRIDPGTAYNFVTTNDIIGGNSGSPVIDRAGSVIGAAFDGNIHSLGGDYGYDPVLNRTVVVSSAAVQEALTDIYPAPALVKELRAK